MLTNQKRPPRLLSDEQESVSADFTLVSLSEMKSFLEVTHSEDDDQIRSHYKTALDWFQRITGHRIHEQTRRVRYDRAAARYELPSKPASSISDVKSSYEGDLSDEDVGQFFLYESEPPEVRVKSGQSWTHPLDFVQFDYVTGYAEKGDVPEGIGEIVRKMVSDLYEFRTSVQLEGNVPRELTITWKEMLTPYSILRF